MHAEETTEKTQQNRSLEEAEQRILSRLDGLRELVESEHARLHRLERRVQEVSERLDDLIGAQASPSNGRAALGDERVAESLRAQQAALNRLQANWFSLFRKLQMVPDSIVARPPSGKVGKASARKVVPPEARRHRTSIGRKLAKLRQTPRKFLTDSSSGLLRTAGETIERVRKRSGGRGPVG